MEWENKMSKLICLQDSWDFEQKDKVICPFCEYKHDSDAFYHGGSFKSSDSDDTIEVWLECDSCQTEFSCTMDKYNQGRGFSSAPIECDKLKKKHRAKFIKTYVEEKTGTNYKIFGCKSCWHKDYRKLNAQGRILTDEEIQAEYRAKEPENQPAEEGKVGEIYTSEEGVSLTTEKALGNREIYLLILDELQTLGYEIGLVERHQKDAQILNYTHSYGIWEGLEFEAHYYPNGLEVKFFQNIYPGKRKKGEGIYEYDKIKYMPYLMLKKLELTKNKIVNVLEQNPRFKMRKKVEDILGWHKCPNLKGLTKEQAVQRIRQNPKDLTKESSCNIKDRDGTIMANGDVRYCYENGILTRGEVYYDLNSTWILVTDKNYYHNQASRLFIYTGKEPVRQNCVKETRMKILQKELEKNIQSSNFEKCIILRDLIKKIVN
jgi:hypothetical protein